MVIGINGSEVLVEGGSSASGGVCGSEEGFVVAEKV